MARSKVAGKSTESGIGLTGAWRVLQVSAVGTVLIAAAEGVLASLIGDSQIRVPTAVMQWGLVLVLALVAWGTFQRARWSAWAGGILAIFAGITTAASVLGPVQIQSTVTVTPLIEQFLEPFSLLLNVAFVFGLFLLRRARK